MFASLPAELRTVIEALYEERLTIRQTAIRLGITQHQVRTRYKQALEQMSREFMRPLAQTRQ